MVTGAESAAGAKMGFDLECVAEGSGDGSLDYREVKN
jgi:hypothetical protein